MLTILRLAVGTFCPQEGLSKHQQYHWINFLHYMFEGRYASLKYISHKISRINRKSWYRMTCCEKVFFRWPRVQLNIQRSSKKFFQHTQPHPFGVWFASAERIQLEKPIFQTRFWRKVADLEESVGCAETTEIATTRILNLKRCVSIDEISDVEFAATLKNVHGFAAKPKQLKAIRYFLRGVDVIISVKRDTNRAWYSIPRLVTAFFS